MVPAWWFVLMCIIATVAVILLIPRLPFPDRRSTIFSVADEKAQLAVIAILRLTTETPLFRADGPLALRAIYADGTIINVPLSVPDQIKEVRAARIRVVNDPLAAALEAQKILKSYKYESEVIEDPDPDLPKGAMVFIISPCFGNGTWMIGYRRFFPFLGPPPPLWDDRN
jgi:hypothetical protein